MKQHSAADQLFENNLETRRIFTAIGHVSFMTTIKNIAERPRWPDCEKIKLKT